jgi:hypothetical protein
MAKKKAARKAKITTLSQLRALQAEHTELIASIRQYVSDVVHPMRSNFQITLPAKTGDKDSMFRVSSVMSSVLTAAGLGQTVRLEAQPAEDGGTLLVRFYKPVNMPAVIADVL